MPAGARYRAPAVFVTLGTALHRRLPCHEALQHSQGLAFPPQCHIRGRRNSTRGPAPRAPGVPRHSCVPHHPGQTELAAYRGHARPAFLVVTNRDHGVRASHIRGLPRRHAATHRATATHRAYAAGTCHRSRQHVRNAGSPSMPGQAPRPRPARANWHCVRTS
jgi:hypothetical protein